jgi:hypothetical protein
MRAFRKLIVTPKQNVHMQNTKKTTMPNLYMKTRYTDHTTVEISNQLVLP